MARLITKDTFSDLAMIYISYVGEAFILRIEILKRNLTTRPCYTAYYSADKFINSFYTTLL